MFQGLLILLILCGALFIFLMALRQDLRARKIAKYTYKLSLSLDNQSVIDYINAIEKLKMPTSPAIINSLRTGYRLVKSSDTIDEQLKLELRIVLIMKGIREIDD